MAVKPGYYEIEEKYSRFTARKKFFILSCIVVLFVMALVAATLGSAEMKVLDILRTIAARIFHFSGVESSHLNNVIIWHLRLPRIVMAIVAGAGLAVAGAAMQGVLRNPLVSPFTVGVSSGAALGASVAIILGASLVGGTKYMVIINAFFFALGAVLLILGIGRLRGITPESFILVGIALMYFFGAATSCLQYIATKEDLHAVTHWLFGTLNGSSWQNILIVLCVMFACIPPLLKHSWDLNSMALGGDDVATSLGINCGRVRIICMILTALITASVISFTGIIAFVCLIAPHITRLIIGGDHRFLLPCSCILGAILLLGADTLGRTVFLPVTIPVGIVISSIGGPFFIYLLVTRRRQYWQ